MWPTAVAIVNTVRPKASDTPSNPMPTSGKAAANTALGLSGRHPWSLSNYAPALVEAGRLNEAKAVVAEMDARAAAGYVQPFMRAQAVAAIGEADRALVLAEEAFETRDPTLVLFGRNWLGSHFLRRDDRFTDILARLNLPDWSPSETL